MSKVTKVRTSITIDPAVLLAAREMVAEQDSGYKSMAAYFGELVFNDLGSDRINSISELAIDNLIESQKKKKMVV